MSEPLLRAENIARSFGRRAVLRDVNLTVAPGALVGIVGENGAGKSTLLQYPRRRATARSRRDDADGALGYCPQEVFLNDTLTVAQHLDYFAAAYGIRDLRRADELVDRLAYQQYRRRYRWQHSVAAPNRKLNLTLALMHHPRVLLLDEPYQGFDWETYLRFWDLAAELRARRRGGAHDLAPALRPASLRRPLSVAKTANSSTVRPSRDAPPSSARR